MKKDEKIGWTLIVVCVIAALVVIFALWKGALEDAIAPAIMSREVKGLCLECGYPKHVVHDGVGYCLRIEAGYDVIVPVEEACPRRVEQGRGKPQ